MYPITANNGLSATRIITALTEDGPEILATVQKILGKPALTDNFAGGYSGHLLCPVDPDSGRLTGVAYGRNPGQRHLLTHFERHPGTGRSWAGFALPHWLHQERRRWLGSAARQPLWKRPLCDKRPLVAMCAARDGECVQTQDADSRLQYRTAAAALRVLDG
jgi:hypothetical protein